MSNLENLVWSEKYRPTKIDDCVLPAGTKDMIKNLLGTGNIPHMLFSGAAGTGKTTLARAIAAELGSDMLFVNASLEANMDMLRTTITQFVTTVSFTDTKKIVLLDEADHINSSVQPALRGFIDQFSNNAIFIMTCNFKARLIDPLISRLQVVEFKFTKEEKQPAASVMLKRCTSILDAESITYDKKAVASVVAKNFPDFRKTLGQLQQYSASGSIDSGIVCMSPNQEIDALMDCVKNKDFTKCRQWVANNSLDAISFYRTFYNRAIELFVPQTLPQTILFISQFQFEASHEVDQEINQIAFLIQIMSIAQFK